MYVLRTCEQTEDRYLADAGAAAFSFETEIAMNHASVKQTGEAKQTLTEDQQSFVDDLRKVASLFEEHPELPVPHQPDFFVAFSNADKTDLRAFALAFRGRGGIRKHVNNEDSQHSDFVLRGHIGMIKIWTAARQRDVCARKRIGTRIVPAEVAVAEYEEAVYEYDCSPILKPDEEREHVLKE